MHMKFNDNIYRLFPDPPVLTGDKICLRPLTTSDAEGLRKLTAQEDVYEMLPAFLFERKYEPEEVIRRLQKKEYKDSLILGIFYEDRFCGLVEVYGFQARYLKAGIGYRLLREEWDKGYAQEALDLIVRELLNNRGIRIITASTMTENKVSAHILEKYGFTRINQAVLEDWGYRTPKRSDKWLLRREAGTSELRTEHLILRKYRPEDAEVLYRELGSDPEMFRHSDWNPYATPEKARESVQNFIDSYSNRHFYGWVLEAGGVLRGTIDAYGFKDGGIEIGGSVVRSSQGRGYATEALKAVLSYLTEHEGIDRVTAWCSAENIGSMRALKMAGMHLASVEKGGLSIGDRTYDKMIYEYTSKRTSEETLI